jgi:3-oxoadipate enol-lactonase
MSDTVEIDTPAGPVSVERSGAGPDLLMLHSLLSDRKVFAPVVDELATRWTLNLIDLPGFGSTPRVGASIDAYADIIGALLRAGEYDPGSTAVLGNGLGAFVALGTAIRHGQLFDRLVLVGCGVMFTEDQKSAFRGMIERVQRAGMDGVVDVAVRRIFSEQYLADHPDVLSERAQVLRRTDPAAFVDACGALIGMDYRSGATDVENPTLIVVGTEDQATSPAMARELHTLLPNSELVEMEGIAHAPQLQAPAGFLDVVARFL